MVRSSFSFVNQAGGRPLPLAESVFFIPSMANDFFISAIRFSHFACRIFGNCWLLKFLLTLGLQIQFVVLSWQVYEITKDPLSLGLLRTGRGDSGCRTGLIRRAT